jgi:hypothetical protein
VLSAENSRPLSRSSDSPFVRHPEGEINIPASQTQATDLSVLILCF